jgi:hypothetical protein
MKYPAWLAASCHTQNVVLARTTHRGTISLREWGVGTYPGDEHNREYTPSEIDNAPDLFQEISEAEAIRRFPEIADWLTAQRKPSPHGSARP